MTNNISAEALKIIQRMQQSELTESVIYEKIAAFAKGEENKKTLRRLAQEEKAHYLIWKKYTGLEMKPETGKVIWYSLIARILGFTFAVKLMERGEESAGAAYQQLLKELPEADRIARDEEEHEKALLSMKPEELLTLPDEEGLVSVDCSFCDRTYRFTREDLEKLIEKRKG